MIIGIGCDIVEHGISKNLNWDTDISILRRIFSQKEIDIYSSEKDLKFLSGRFAAKEAVLKSLGTGMQDGIELPDIEILQLPNGEPVINLFGGVKKIADMIEINCLHITITHSGKHSMAFVIAEKL